MNFRYIFIFLLTGFFSSAQNKLSDFNDSILNYVLEKKYTSDAYFQDKYTSSSEELNDVIEKKIEDLKRQNITNIICFTIDFIGMHRTSRKEENGKPIIIVENSPTDVYIIFQQNEKVNVLSFKDNKFTILAESVINPFLINIKDLDQQSFIAPIENYTITDQKITNAFYGLTDHQRVYSLVYLQNNKIIRHFFEAEYIENEKSIFFDYNKKLMLHEFFKYVNVLVKDLYLKKTFINYTAPK